MKKHSLGIIMNGVTGRMGTNQHYIRSILAIRKLGGLKINDSEVIWPEPVLIGRSESKLAQLASMDPGVRWSTDLDAELAKPENVIYFDSQTTGRRAEGVRKAVAAGKHIYCEKPIAVDSKTALELHELCKKAGVKNGVVQDKLWLPGLLKLKYLIDTGFFGRSSRCAANSVTGYSPASTRNCSVLRGTTARKTTAGSSWTCSATGNMSSRISSATSSR